MGIGEMIADMEKLGYQKASNGDSVHSVRYTLDLTDPRTEAIVGHREVTVNSENYRCGNGSKVSFSLIVNEWLVDGGLMNAYHGNFGKDGKALDPDARQIYASIKNKSLIRSRSK